MFNRIALAINYNKDNDFKQDPDPVFSFISVFKWLNTTQKGFFSNKVLSSSVSLQVFEENGENIYEIYLGFISIYIFPGFSMEIGYDFAKKTWTITFSCKQEVKVAGFDQNKCLPM